MTRPSSAFCARIARLFFLPVRLIFGVSPTVGIVLGAMAIAAILKPSLEVIEMWRTNAADTAWSDAKREEIQARQQKQHDCDHSDPPCELSAK